MYNLLLKALLGGAQMDLLYQVRKYIEKQSLIQKRQRIILGVSGGMDSMFLLHAMKHWQEHFEVELVAVHVNHMIRESATNDQYFVERACSSAKVPCIVVTQDVPTYAKNRRIGIEEAGREVRMEAFCKIATIYQADAIMLAHHLNDHMETMLLHFFRGCSARGLSGIRPKNGNVLHPLVEISKEEMAQFMKKNELDWCEDETNLHDDYSRNFLRNRLIPMIEQSIQPGLKKTLQTQSIIFSELDEYMMQQAKRIITEQAVFIESAERRCYEISNNVLKNSHKALRRYVIYYMLQECLVHLKDIGFAHIDAICQLVESEHGKHLDLARNVVVERREKKIYITYKKE